MRGIRPGGAADDAKPSLETDDVIVTIDGEAVKDVDDPDRPDRRARRGRVPNRSRCCVAFDRKGERMLTVLELARPGLQDPGMEARKAWIPVAVQAITSELADKLGVAGRPGVRVTRVFGGGAAKAGLEVGDLILAVDGNPVEASQPSEADVFDTMIRQ